MICPICQAEVNPKGSFCQYCGAKLNTDVTTNYVETSELVKPKKEKEMIFNIVFAIMMFWNGVTSLFGSFGVIPTIFINTSSIATIVNVVSIVGSLLLSAFGIATGITLLKKMKVGYILSNIANIIYCIGNTIVFVLGIFATYFGATDQSEYAAIGYLFAVIFFIASVPSLALHIFSLIYYRKNKHRFIN